MSYPQTYYRVDVIQRTPKKTRYKVSASSFGRSDEEVVRRMQDRFPQAIEIRIISRLPADRLYGKHKHGL